MQVTPTSNELKNYKSTQTYWVVIIVKCFHSYHHNFYKASLHKTSSYMKIMKNYILLGPLPMLCTAWSFSYFSNSKTTWWHIILMFNFPQGSFQYQFSALSHKSKYLIIRQSSEFSLSLFKMRTAFLFQRHINYSMGCCSNTKELNSHPSHKY